MDFRAGGDGRQGPAPGGIPEFRGFGLARWLTQADPGVVLPMPEPQQDYPALPQGIILERVQIQRLRQEIAVLRRRLGRPAGPAN